MRHTRQELRTLAFEQGCTLDGRRASVQGARNDFATVHTMDGRAPRYGVEFAWATVEHILTRESDRGAFKS